MVHLLTSPKLYSTLHMTLTLISSVLRHSHSPRNDKTAVIGAAARVIEILSLLQLHIHGVLTHTPDTVLNSSQALPHLILTKLFYSGKHPYSHFTGKKPKIQRLLLNLLKITAGLEGQLAGFQSLFS